MAHCLMRPLNSGEPNLKRKESIGGMLAYIEPRESLPGEKSRDRVVNWFGGRLLESEPKVPRGVTTLRQLWLASEIERTPSIAKNSWVWFSRRYSPGIKSN